MWRWDGRSNAGRVLARRLLPRGPAGLGGERHDPAVDQRRRRDRARRRSAGPQPPDRLPRCDSGRGQPRDVATCARAGPSEDRLYGVYYGDRPIRLTARLVVVDADGEKVLDAPARRVSGRHATPRTVRSSAAPTPAGSVTDEAGNRVDPAQTVTVSDAQLAERCWTATIPAASADPVRTAGLRPVVHWAAARCCGPVPSDRFAGGLSFRQPCTLRLRRRRVLRAAPPDVRPGRRLPRHRHRRSDDAGCTDIAHLERARPRPGTRRDDALGVASTWTPTRTCRTQASDELGVSTSDENDYDIASFTVEYRHYVPVACDQRAPRWTLSRRC